MKSWVRWSIEEAPLKMFSLFITVVFLGSIAIHTFRAYYRLRHFPGPFLASFSKLWMIRNTITGRMHLEIADVCEKYGPLARISPDDLVTNDPEILRRMSAVRSPYTRSDWYEIFQFDPKHNHVFAELDEKRHSDLRSRTATGYSGKENPHLEESIDSRLLDFIGLLRDKYISRGSDLRPLDFALVAQFFTLDVISDIAFGEPLGFMAKNADLYEYIETSRGIFPMLEWLATLPSLNRFMKNRWIRKFTGPTPKDKTGIGKVMGVGQQLVAKRFGLGKDARQDMLGSFISHGLTQEQAESESVLQIMAGSDTTVTALRSIFLFIITQPHIYNTLRAEIAKAERSNLISNPIIRESEAKQLPYLQACIKEGLRFWPPVVGLMQKRVPDGGDTLNGQYVPGGTKIGYCGWGLQRRKDIFGEDVNLYRPERWLDVDEERLKRMERVTDLVFGSGKYGCLGKSIAMLELNKVFVELLRHFDFALVDPTNPWRVICSNGMFLCSDMFLRVSERSEIG